jgi:hypothetical protein
MSQLDFFSPVRVRRVMQGVYDPRLMPQPLIWDRRIPTVPAADGEIMGRFEGFPMIADLIALDAQAVTYEFGKFQFYATRAPKLKMGIGLNETMLAALDRMNQNAATQDDIGIFRNWEQRMISSVRYGVDIRREALLISMLFDGLNYNRMGIIISGGTWGMFSDLKVTVGTSWDQTTAKPITDIQTIRRTARMRYGINYNRITMSSQALLYASATTEFQNQAKAFVTPFLFGGPAPASPTQSDGYLAALLGRILSGVPGQDSGGLGGMTIELDDRRFWQKNSDGTTSSINLWPTAGVVLSDSSQDGNTMTWDFANGRLVEKIVADVAGGMAPPVIDSYGPTVYPTLSNLQLNAPGLSYWGAQYGFPRKHLRAANAAMVVGTFADGVASTLPF